jgi:hypothetical protein
MAEARNVRASESRKEDRADEARPQTAWKPPSLLDAPEARPGMVQRWVATSIQGKDTPDNVYKRMRAGWNPRPADSVKDKRFPTINHGQWAGSIGVEGMLLCEMPEETFKSRTNQSRVNLMRWEEIAASLSFRTGRAPQAKVGMSRSWMTNHIIGVN